MLLTNQSNLTYGALEQEEDFHVGYSHPANVALFTASFCFNNLFGSFLIFCLDRDVLLKIVSLIHVNKPYIAFLCSQICGGEPICHPAGEDTGDGPEGGGLRVLCDWAIRLLE